MSGAQTVQTGRFPRRYRKPDFDRANLIPDSLHNEDGTFSVNPEWTEAIYEETFIAKDGRRLDGLSEYEAFRELNRERFQPCVHEEIEGEGRE